MVMTVFSRGIRSSMERSYSSKPMEVLLSSPYFSDTVRISLRITPRSTLRSARMAFNCSMRAISSLYSFSSFSLSRPVRARRRMSTIAWAWASLSSKRSIRFFFASAAFADARMIWITSSIWSSAFKSPSRIWLLSCALFRSYFVLLVTTSSWCCR